MKHLKTIAGRKEVGQSPKKTALATSHLQHGPDRVSSKELGIPWMPRGDDYQVLLPCICAELRSSQVNDLILNTSPELFWDTGWTANFQTSKNRLSESPGCRFGSLTFRAFWPGRSHFLVLLSFSKEGYRKRDNDQAKNPLFDKEARYQWFNDWKIKKDTD